MSKPDRKARAPLKPVIIRLCVYCGTRYLGFTTNKWTGFCKDSHYTSHISKHKETAAYRYKRNCSLRWSKKQHTAPSKTLEEDLAWMYEAKDAFHDSKQQQGRREGGAGPRRKRAKIIH